MGGRILLCVGTRGNTAHLNLDVAVTRRSRGKSSVHGRRLLKPDWSRICLCNFSLVAS